MKSINIELPENLDMDEKEIKMDLACQWYCKGKLSIGQAAEMVGYSKETFMELLADRGVAFYTYLPEEIEEDVTNATKHSI